MEVKASRYSNRYLLGPVVPKLLSLYTLVNKLIGSLTYTNIYTCLIYTMHRTLDRTGLENPPRQGAMTPLSRCVRNILCSICGHMGVTSRGLPVGDQDSYEQVYWTATSRYRVQLRVGDQDSYKQVQSTATSMHRYRGQLRVCIGIEDSYEQVIRTATSRYRVPLRVSEPEGCEQVIRIATSK